MSITDLPLELLTRICEHLEPQEWGAFRISCRQIYDNTLEAYTTRYFKRVTILLTREGLDRLEYVAASETLRGSVEEIWIIPNLFDHWANLDKASFTKVDIRRYLLRLGRHPTTEEHNEVQAELEALFAVYEATMAEHRAILEPPGLLGRLEKCLPRLEKAVTLGLRSYETRFLLNKARNTDFTCLGLRELKSHFNFKRSPMFHQSVSYMPYSLVFLQLLNAIVKSNRKVQALHTCSHYFCGMKLESFQLPESQYQSLLPLLKDLTTLHMCIRLKDHEQENFDEDTFKRLLNIMITAAPTLKTLSFAQWSPIEELSPRYFKDVSQRIQFTQLEELHLHSIEVTVNSLEEFLRTAAPTLKRLSLRLVSLVDGITSAPDLGSLTQNSRSWVTSMSTEVRTEIQGLWKRVFEFWADHLKPQYVEVSVLGYRGRSITLHDNLYMERGQRDAEPFPGVNPSSFYFDVEKANLSFKEWVTQLQIEMVHQPFLGGPKLPGTSKIHLHAPGQDFSGQFPAVCRNPSSMSRALIG
ncbi:hypothetical protein N7462_008697 [Penicillium macrosclerotiorum]|uniref:uncharacterized protein n=1 Tax=Penicillium macrosclerotiorum TaxID=303699 RepID=UPI002549388F|nr:uncharacterized protein N7462_008697 [Penicillium macrosclerotiorum]KAJ5675800.1 hypothetical protein N7462_008697 [Penicillium macrosclerotiorum]